MVPNRALRQPEYDENGFIRTNSEATFVNRVAYEKGGKTE